MATASPPLCAKPVGTFMSCRSLTSLALRSPALRLLHPQEALRRHPTMDHRRRWMAC
ncbi:unnamed protein product [Effrenium voratum]|nr:unnamed protein product [Effrenium voratum]